MTHQDRPALHVLGLTISTSADRAPRDIAALWERAAGLQIFDGPDAYAVYHHYAFPTGEPLRYDVTVGRAAPADAAVPEGLSLVTVPAQRCEVIATDGSIADVQQAWQRVWTDAPTGRALIADVEAWRMGPHGQPISAEIYLGVRG